MKLSLLDAIHLADEDSTRWGPEPDTDGPAAGPHDSVHSQPTPCTVDDPSVLNRPAFATDDHGPVESSSAPPPLGYTLEVAYFVSGSPEIEDDQIEAMERLRYDVGFDPFPSDQARISRPLVAAIAKSVPDMRDPAAVLREMSPIPPADLSSAGFFSHIFFPGEIAVLLNDVWNKGHPYLVGRDGEDSPQDIIDDFYFLINPVDGEVRPNAKGYRPSIRNTPCITSFRHLLLRLPTKNIDQTLRMIFGLPLRIVSITTLPGGQVDVLIRINASSYESYRTKRRFFSKHGGALGAERSRTHQAAISMLPNVTGEEGTQELLYLDPDPTTRPISARF